MDPWSEAIFAALDKVRPAVAHVAAVNPAENSLVFGTGLVVDTYHVITSVQCKDATDVSVFTADKRKYGATVLAYDPLYFLTVLKVDRRFEVERVASDNSDQLRAGQLVLAIGNPFGVDQTVSQGVVSAPDRTIYRPERYPVDGLILTDAAIHPGNSGGPLVSLEGQILGVNGVPWVHGLGLCVQINVVMRIANQIIEYGRATHPWLGFSGQNENIDPALVSLFDLPVREGLLVEFVDAGGPASRAGMAVKDLVVKVKNRPVFNVGGLRKALSVHRPGDLVPVTIYRDGGLRQLAFPVEQIPGLFATQ